MFQPQLYSAPQAAAYLGISLNTMYRWLAAGYIPTAQRTPSGRWRIPSKDLATLNKPLCAA